MVLESVKHAGSVFVTLTYASGQLPSHLTEKFRSDGPYSRMDNMEVVLPSLYPRDVQLWLKRFRKAHGKCRYFLVGEYGEERDRPHYHALLFGVQHKVCIGCQFERKRDLCNCTISTTWGLGGVFVGDVTLESASYCAGYVVKKLTVQDAPELLGRHPEFARMSLKPGIGADAIPEIAAALNNEAGAKEVLDTGDVPSVLRVCGKKFPIGRYLKGKLADQLGYDQELLKNARMARFRNEMDIFYSEHLEPDKHSGQFRSIYCRDALVQESAQAAEKQKFRQNLWKKRRSL